VNQKVELTKRRDTLQSRINAWNHKADQYLSTSNIDEEQELQDMLDQDAEESGQTDAEVEHLADPSALDAHANANANTDTELESASEATDLHFQKSTADALSAENIQLYLPSSFAMTRFPVPAAKELELRLGQANDALHNLRIALGKKSFLFRSHVRAARSQQRKTRAWAEVSSVDADVRQQARIYASTRRKMIVLGATDEILDRYKVLKYADLKISTAIATPNAPGQRDTRLSWFWSMDVQADADADDWMEECGLNVHTGPESC
jgi:hypothetical protein